MNTTYIKHQKTIDTILKAVEEVTKVDKEDLMSQTRKREIVEARHIAMSMMRNHCQFISLSEIASIFNRDHATVIHAIRKANDLTEWDTVFRLKHHAVQNYYDMISDIEEAPDELNNLRAHIISLIREYKRMKKSRAVLQTTEESVS